MTIILDIKSPDDWIFRPKFHEQLEAKRDDLGHIVGKYSLPRPPAGSPTNTGRVLCGLNGCKTPHFDGYLIVLKDGRETIIGNECGEREFGVAFKDVEATFRALETVAIRKKVVDDLQASRAQLIAEAERILPEVKTLSEQTQAIKTDLEKFPAFWRRVSELSKQDGRILVAADRSEMQEHRGPVDLVEIARVQHSKLFIDDTTTHERALRIQVIHWLRNDLDQAIADAKDNDKALAQLSKQAGELQDILRAANGFIADAAAFLKPNNLGGLKLIEQRLLTSSQRSSALSRALRRVCG